MRDVELGRRDHGLAQADESPGTPGRETNVPDHGAARGGGAPYKMATMAGDRVPWSDRPEAAPRVDTPRLASASSGPGLRAVQKLYTNHASGDGGHPDLTAEVAKIVERNPDEYAAIRAFVEERDGADAGHALLAAIEEGKRKKNGITFKEGAIDFGGSGLLPRLRPTWAGGVSHEKDSRLEAEAADFKKDEARRVTAKGDKPYNPIVDALNRARTGPELKSKEQLASEDKITAALEDERNRKAQPDGGTPDAGTPGDAPLLELRKGLDD